MAVNLLDCTESAWRGAGDRCRWCNLQQPRGGFRFCSKECTSAYAVNHMYARGKELTLVWNRTCEHKSMSPQGAYLAGEPPTVHYYATPPPHVVCAGCGQCEEQIASRGDRITINHINPRNGIPMNESDCIHHLDNLEPLCWACHEQLNKLGNVREKLTEWLAYWLPNGWPLEGT